MVEGDDGWLAGLVADHRVIVCIRLLTEKEPYDLNVDITVSHLAVW